MLRCPASLEKTEIIRKDAAKFRAFLNLSKHTLMNMKSPYCNGNIIKKEKQMRNMTLLIIWTILFIFPCIIFASNLEKRLALSIGNRDYMSPPLAHPKNVTLQDIQIPRINIIEMFQQVRRDEYQASPKKQLPCESNALIKKFSYKPLFADVSTGTLHVKNELETDLKPPAKQTFTNKWGMTFVRIPSGSFIMGSPANMKQRDDDEVQHKVTITQDFFMQTTEVNQGQWKEIMDSNPLKTIMDSQPLKTIMDSKPMKVLIDHNPLKAVMENNPSNFKDCGDDCPVENVSWDDVQTFLKKINKMGNGLTYRLPTEAEWEYAARANTTTPFAFGNCLNANDANFNAYYPLADCSKSQFREKTIPVGSLRKNAWGLYDMHGNVWEWCQDRYGEYPTGSVNNPTGPTKGADRVIRGGSWLDNAKSCRSADRNRCGPGFGLRHLGFRLCVSTID